MNVGSSKSASVIVKLDPHPLAGEMRNEYPVYVSSQAPAKRPRSMILSVTSINTIVSPPTTSFKTKDVVKSASFLQLESCIASSYLLPA